VKPRLAARVDGTQPTIVATLRMAGAEVLVLDVSAEGEPDLLVGWCGTLTLIEAKSKEGRLSIAQLGRHAAWARAGVKVQVVRSPREALEAIGVVGPRAEENLRAMRSLVSQQAREKKARGRLVPAVRRP